MASVLLTVVVAFVANTALDVWHVAPESARFADHSVAEELALRLLGSLVVWLFVVLVVAVLGRLWVGIGVVATATFLLGFANYRKQQMLTEPLYPSDLVFLSDPALLAGSAGVEVVLALLAVSALVVWAAALTGRRLGRWFPRPGRARPRLARALLGVRLVAGVSSLAAIAHLVGFHDPGHVYKAAYDESGARWRPWHQRANYIDNGFVAGMLYNMPVRAMHKPPDYGPANMRELLQRYTRVAAGINRSRDPAALEQVNVVFLLGEAFTDVTRAKGVRLAADPIPYTRSLMRRTTAGSMWSPKYGGGTANVEFEALTGLSLAQFRPQLTTPFQMLVPNHDEFPSAVRFLEQVGLRSLAIHSYSSALYRREEAYPILGFEDAVFQGEMTHTDTLEDNPFISDAATYTEALARLGAAEEPMFLNVVTMQNHYPMAGKYEHPIPAAGLPAGEATETIEHYARGLRYSDTAMRRFIGALEATDEKTVVVFYGDHLPPVWPPSLLTKRMSHETPFFVYANFVQPRPERLPTTSPIYFMNHVLDLTDAYVSPYYALLQQLEQEIPAMGPGVMIGPDDEWLSREELPVRARRLLHDYRLVQYDLSVGRRYVADALFDRSPRTGLP